MKHLLLLFAFLPFISFGQTTVDYVVLSGQITEKSSDSLVVRGRNVKKTIRVNADGTFRDTFTITPGIYNLYDGSESTSIFLRNGFDLHLTLDTREFDETIRYSGTGAEHSNFLVRKYLMEEKLLNMEALAEIEEEAALDEAIDAIRGELTRFYAAAGDIDSLVTREATGSLEPMLTSYSRYLKSSIALKKELPNGSPSPSFSDFENIDGTTTSLSDLKGHYVYVDVWATWCGPCKAEIPHLKEVEQAYHDRNIRFVSLSIDDDRTHGDSWDKAREDWKAMVAEKELGGIQLFAPNGWKTDFVTAYKINGIPRFILIDPDGNIVSPDAPRPSSSKLKELLDSLDL
ncbi:MAG: TlpA disulfide reductase family protein [Saprospiraceae bacterium]